MTTDDGAAERERGRVIAEHEQRRGPIESYARGEVRAYHGIVNRWLLVVYAALGVWGVYYLFTHWGGLGPGLAR
jgi:hypothetical protein